MKVNEIKCIYKELNGGENCLKCNSAKCENEMRNRGIYYTTQHFIHYVKKEEKNERYNFLTKLFSFVRMRELERKIKGIFILINKKILSLMETIQPLDKLFFQ
jgi:hypothetical protein